jgi:hypothetical protein
LANSSAVRRGLRRTTRTIPRSRASIPIVTCQPIKTLGTVSYVATSRGAPSGVWGRPSTCPLLMPQSLLSS